MKFNWKKVSVFLIVQLIIPMVTMPLLIFYGPFENVKYTMVGSAMNTFSHQYIATFFLTDEAIARILGTEEEGQNNLQVVTPLQTPDFTDIEHNSKIERYEINGMSFNGYLLKIYDPSRVKVGYSKKIPKMGETTSAIAKSYNAVAAINGGGFGDHEWAGTGGSAVGVIVSKGEIVYNEHKDEPDAVFDIIGINTKNQLVLGEYTVKDIKEAGIMEAVSFVKSALVVNGQPMIKWGDGGWGIAPRTAIGQTRSGEILFLVIDGRTIKSIGATLKDVQDVMLQYGAYTASNLDGGSSTTMYLDRKVINQPTDALGERAIPTTFIALP